MSLQYLDKTTLKFLQAFCHGVHYPTHLLLTFQWYEERWWLKENGASDVNLTCTAEERETVLMHSLAFNFVLSDYLKNQDVTTDVGIVRRMQLVIGLFNFFFCFLDWCRVPFKRERSAWGCPLLL